MKVTLSTQGGYVKAIELLGYSSYDEYKKKGNHPLKLLTGSCFDFVIPTEQGTIHTKDCLFKQVKSDNPRQVTFVYEIPNQKEAYIRQTFSLKKTDYQVTCHIETTGIQLASETKAPLLRWRQDVRRTEKDAEINQKEAAIYYQLADPNKVKYSGYRNKKEEVQEITQRVGWVTFNTKFFSTGIIFEQPAQKATLLSNPITDKKDPTRLKEVGMEVTLDRGELIEKRGITFDIYCGPNTQEDLGAVGAPKFEENYYLGITPFRQINKYLLLPATKKLEGYTPNYLVILLLLLLILTLIKLPFTYHSYLNAIKEKTLAPMIAQIKQRYPEDPLKVQIEKRKLRNRAGMGFSIWTLLAAFAQIPVFITMMDFIKYNIGFRQASFLWIDDLSIYDSILKLPFRVPYFGFSHISLVALLAALGMFIPTWIKNRKKQLRTEEKIMQCMPSTLFFLLFSSHSAAFFIYRVTSQVLNLIPTFCFRFFVNEKLIQQKVGDNLAKSATPISSSSRAHKRMMKKKKK